MQGQASEKVQGGKLVRASVDYDGTILDVTITGDFFLHPEEGIELIEASLVGLPHTVPEEELRRRIERVVDVNGLTLVGITPDAIARLVKQVMSHG